MSGYLRQQAVPKQHDLKTHPVFYRAVLAGIKPFEVRINNRNFQAGDCLLLREWEPDVKEFTGRMLRADVTYMLDSMVFEGLTDGYCVLGLANVRQLES